MSGRLKATNLVLDLISERATVATTTISASCEIQLNLIRRSGDPLLCLIGALTHKSYRDTYRF